MSLHGIVQTARSLSYFERWQQVTANNVANANTDAFKADRVTATTTRGDSTPVPIGHIDLSPGALRDTGRPLDVAIEGNGFLVVGTKDGERLTRGGSLRLDADGMLTDAHGDAVLGANGPMGLRGGQVEIKDDGSVLVDGAPVDRLRVIAPDDPSKLLKTGQGRYIAGSPVTAVSDETTHVKQGQLEDPNVDPVLSMVEMITIQRAYATNIEALRTMDGVMGTVTGEVGKV